MRGTMLWGLVCMLGCGGPVAVPPSAPVAVKEGEREGRPGKADDPRRHVERPGGFSYVPPDGWKIRDHPGAKFKTAVGTPSKGFAPNIFVVEQSFSGSLADYVEYNVAFWRKVNDAGKLVKKSRYIRQEDFATSAGLRGGRWVVENEQSETLVRQTFYFFDGGNTKFVLTCSALAEGGEKLDPVFEASMKTFRFERE